MPHADSNLAVNAATTAAAVRRMRGVGRVRSRRGFTILEVALASVIGVVIVGVCAVMLTTLERTDECDANADSISPSSMRNPRILT